MKTEAMPMRTVFDETPPVPEKPRRESSRPRGRAAGDTRERILDAAERLFANEGYDGASIRDVASAAGVQINAVAYHFGPKEDLFDTVVRRRAVIMTELRETALAKARAAANGRPVPIAVLVRDYILPFLQSASHGDSGWQNFATLMGRLANSALGTEIIGRHYDETARAYIAEFRRALPGVAEADVIDGFSSMVAAMLSACAETGRAQRLSQKKAKSRRPLESLGTLVAYHAAGFAALRDIKPVDDGK